jgi:uncharacterized membrane protein YraQ (UPF0718 family)
MQTSSNENSPSPYARLMILALVAVIGFAYVKWIPYYGKAFYAQSHHAIGDSILSGKSATAPPVSWDAAIAYAMTYTKAIWQALVLGLVLGVAYLAERYATAHEDVPIEKVQPPMDAQAAQGNLLLRWLREFLSMAVKLLPEYLLLVLLLGAARAWLFPELGAHDGIVWIVAMALAGTLFVIPTAGEVPIVQAMMALGMGAGPAGALIMTLPAVSLPSLVMLGRTISLRTRMLIAAGVALSGVMAGCIATFLF